MTGFETDSPEPIARPLGQLKPHVTTCGNWLPLHSNIIKPSGRPKPLYITGNPATLEQFPSFRLELQRSCSAVDCDRLNNTRLVIGMSLNGKAHCEKQWAPPRRQARKERTATAV